MSRAVGSCASKTPSRWAAWFLNDSRVGISDAVEATCASEPRHVEFADQLCLEPRVGQVERVLLGLQVVLGDLQSPLIAAKFEIIPRDLCQQRHQRIAPALRPPRRCRRWPLRPFGGRRRRRRVPSWRRSRRCTGRDPDPARRCCRTGLTPPPPPELPWPALPKSNAFSLDRLWGIRATGVDVREEIRADDAALGAGFSDAGPWQLSGRDLRRWPDQSGC